MINRDSQTFQGGKILSDGETLVRAINESEMEHISATESDSFTWQSGYAATGGEEVLTIENTENDRVLVIEKVFLSVSATASTVFTVGDVLSGTPAGTTITPACFNRETVKSGTSRSSAFGDASVTGTVVITPKWKIPVAVDGTAIIDTEGAWLLGKGDALGVSSSVTAVVSVTVEGYFAETTEL